ncbi:hypothetical protein J4214_01225 [Candidatus Woesearchaeota archaeon]|nr:hypothetical protein [Candidatus Woesearchaeota archaeon]
MVLSEEKANEIKESFRREFLSDLDYLVLSINRSKETETSLIGDYYLRLSLYRDSPTEIPETYKGMKVFYSVLDDISFA